MTEKMETGRAWFMIIQVKVITSFGKVFRLLKLYYLIIEVNSENVRIMERG